MGKCRGGLASLSQSTCHGDQIIDYFRSTGQHIPWIFVPHHVIGNAHPFGDSEQLKGSPSALIAIGAIECLVIPRSLQYFELSHISSDLVPLLELQLVQQSAMFEALTSDSSLMMCSHDAHVVRGLGDVSNNRLQ